VKVEEMIAFINENVPFDYYGNEFPKAANDNCGVVRVDGGGTPDLYTVGLKNPSVQVIIRHRKAIDAETISQDVWNLFHAKEHYDVGNTKVYISMCDQSEPLYIGKDENNRTIYSINLTCKTFDQLN
jgi:hypothetical protein